MALSPAEEAQTRELLAQQAAILSLADSEAAIISNLGATDVSLSDLSAATTVADADLLLIRQGVTDKSVSGLIIKGLASVPDARETVKGIVELATAAETQAGTDAVRAVTPAALASVTATETRAGLVELATSVEAQAGTANKFIDGAKLAEAFKGSNYSLATNGYQKLPSGLIIQWGRIPYAGSSGDGGTTVSLPIAFPTASLRAVGVDAGSGAFSVGVQSVGLSQIKGWAKNVGAYADGVIDYIAIGY